MRCPTCDHHAPAARLGEDCPRCDGVLVAQATLAAWPADRFLGRRIDRFALVDRLGAGRESAVYRALPAPGQPPVALKLMPLGDDPRRRDRFARETAALRALGAEAGPRLVQCGEVRIGDRPWLYLACDLIVGTPLSAMLAEHHRLPLEAAHDIADGVLACLAAAHARGVVHRDLKPAHVLLATQALEGKVPKPRRVHLLDFGIARIAAPEDPGGLLATLTTTGAVVGTPQYTAPEQIDARAPVGPATDLYAVGILLHEMLTGARPFDALDPLTVLRAQLTAPVPHLGGPLGPVVARALAKNPAERYPSADAMRDAMRDAMSNAMGDAMRDAIPRPPHDSQHRALAAALTLMLTALAALAALALLA